MASCKQIIALFTAAILLGFSCQAYAGPTPAPPHPQQIATVGNMLSSPIYVNLYWDKFWDLDHPTMPMAALDSFTAAVLNSSYFDGLAEYGVGRPTYGGGFLPAGACPLKPPPRVLFYNPAYASIIGFLNCELQADPSIPQGSQVIYNIILPNGTLEDELQLISSILSIFSPQGPVAWHFHGTPYSLAGVLAIGSAALAAGTGAGAAAFQAFLLALGSVEQGPLYTIETADPRSGPGGNVLTSSLIHEMVEAATDPFVTSFDSIYNEIADVAASQTIPAKTAACPGTSPCPGACPDTHPFVPPPPPSSSITPLGGFTNIATLSVPQYWSNSGQTCTTGFTSAATPSIAGVVPMVVDGTFGPKLTITINGNGFGTLPASTSLFASLPYFAVQDDIKNLQAGNALNNNSRFFTVTSWANDHISFDGTSLPGPWPVDSFSFWVCNPQSGNCTWGVFPPTVTAVSPSTMTCGGTGNTGTSVGITGSNFYNVADAKLDGFVPLLNASASSLSMMSATIPASVSAGSHLLTVDALGGSSAGQGQPVTVSVAPTITGVIPNSGPNAGGTFVVIKGGCLDNAAVSFGNTPAYFDCRNGCAAVTQPSSTVGVPVDVVASVGNPAVSSAKSAADQFTYLGPTITSVSPSTGPMTGGTSITLAGANFALYGHGQTMDVSFVGPGFSTKVVAQCHSEFSCSVLTPPVNPPQPVPLKVNVNATVAGASSATSTADVFTYDSQNAVLASISVAPGIGGVQLNGNAPPGGAVINLQSSDPVVAVPATTTVDGNSSVGLFSVTVFPTPSAKTVKVTATYLNSSVFMNVSAPAWPPLSISPGSVALAYRQSATMTVTLNTPPAANADVKLTSTDPKLLSVPPSVTIPAGQYRASFPVTSHYQSPSNVTAEADIAAAYNGMSATAKILLTQRAACFQPPTCPKGFYFDENTCKCVKGPPPPPKKQANRP